MQLTVSTHTPRRLVLRLRPKSVAAYWGFGFLFIAAGGGTAWLLSRAAALECVRDAGGGGSCIYTSTAGLHTRREMFAASSLRGADVRLHDAALLKSKVLVVRTDRGELPLNLLNADGQAKDSLAAVIAAFVRDASTPAVRVREDDRLIGLLLGLFLVAAGVLCIAVIERCVLVMDRDRGAVRVRTVRHGRRRRVDIPLDRVLGVAAEEFRVRGTRSWSVHLELDGRARAPLTRAPLFTDRSAEQTVGVIRSWLEGAPS